MLLVFSLAGSARRPRCCNPRWRICSASSPYRSLSSSCSCLSSAAAKPMSVTATVDGTPVFGGVDAGMFYRKNWNMFRLTGRGLADSAESPVVQILPDSLTILMR